MKNTEQLIRDVLLFKSVSRYRHDSEIRSPNNAKAISSNQRFHLTLVLHRGDTESMYYGPLYLGEQTYFGLVPVFLETRNST